MNKDAVFQTLREVMISEFALVPASISLDKRLHDDLELDSLDMVDLILALKNHINEKIDPNLFKNVCTVQDLVDSVYPLWK